MCLRGYGAVSQSHPSPPFFPLFLSSCSPSPPSSTFSSHRHRIIKRPTLPFFTCMQDIDNTTLLFLLLLLLRWGTHTFLLIGVGTRSRTRANLATVQSPPSYIGPWGQGLAQSQRNALRPLGEFPWVHTLFLYI